MRKIAFRYEFVPIGSVIERRYDNFVLSGKDRRWRINSTVFCDVGNSLQAGLIDHHQLEGEAQSSTSLFVYDPGYFVSELDAAQNEISLVTHSMPDLDGVTCLYLLGEFIKDRRLPAGARVLARFVREVDSGRHRIDPSSPVDLATLFLAASRNTGTDHGPANDATPGYLRKATRVISFVARNARTLSEIKSPEIYDEAPGALTLKRMIEKDFDVYQADVRECSETTEIKLENFLTGKLEGVHFLISINPKSFMWKYWARSDVRNSPSKRGFAGTCAIWTNGGFQKRTRAIISVDPNTKLWLKGLGLFLDYFEIEELLKRGAGLSKLADRPRPGFHRNDPWFDGRGQFNFTVVDTPSRLSVLSEDVITECLRNSDTWIGIGKQFEHYRKSLSSIIGKGFRLDQ